jgi:hypothetical protein
VGGLTWHRYDEQLFGRELVRFHYGQVGLRDLSSENFLALAALMRPEHESSAFQTQSATHGGG